MQAKIGIANFYGTKYKLSFMELLKQIGGVMLFGKNGETQLGEQHGSLEYYL